MVMKPGDIVDPKARSTPSGFPVSWGPAKLIRKIGTVPNFWEFQLLADGKVMRGMVHEEDFLEAGPGPNLRLV